MAVANPLFGLLSRTPSAASALMRQPGALPANHARNPLLRLEQPAGPFNPFALPKLQLLPGTGEAVGTPSLPALPLPLKRDALALLTRIHKALDGCANGIQVPEQLLVPLTDQAPNHVVSLAHALAQLNQEQAALAGQVYRAQVAIQQQQTGEAPQVQIKQQESLLRQRAGSVAQKQQDVANAIAQCVQPPFKMFAVLGKSIAAFAWVLKLACLAMFAAACFFPLGPIFVALVLSCLFLLLLICDCTGGNWLFSQLDALVEQPKKSGKNALRQAQEDICQQLQACVDQGAAAAQPAAVANPLALGPFAQTLAAFPSEQASALADLFAAHQEILQRLLPQKT